MDDHEYTVHHWRIFVSNNASKASYSRVDQNFRHLTFFSSILTILLFNSTNNNNNDNDKIWKDVLALIETDKVTVDIKATKAGVITKQFGEM